MLVKNKERKIEKITIDDKLYPDLLRNIKKPPKQLYFVGDISILKLKSVAIVGSRQYTPYGRWAGMQIGKRLAECGAAVISGMARGIDSASHTGALEANGKTVAVMGCGVDICFPAGNRHLWESIIENGLVVSEYLPGTKPAKYTFPERNRIISGLSLATVVVEAGVRSGSLITAELAAEQGRTVYAVPGNINSVSSLGTNQLIRDGATPLAVIEDLICDLGLTVNEEKNDDEDLNNDEKIIYNIIRQGGEMTMDEISNKSGRSIFYVTGIVTVLEIKGKICTHLGKIFVANA